MYKIAILTFLSLILSGCVAAESEIDNSVEDGYTSVVNSAFDQSKVTLTIKEP